MQYYPKSKHHDQLYFADIPPGKTAYFEHPFDGYSLEARVLFNEQHAAPWILMVHGARGDYTKANAISFGLQERGYSLLGMAMSGHSEAGVLRANQTTLGANIQEVEAFFGDLDPKRAKKVVFGFSLGGTPALKLLESHGDEIDALVLFYPALYSVESYNKHYGEAFRSVIRQPYSYRNNDTIDLLCSFKGRLLLIVGEYDGLDPVQYGQPAGMAAGQVTIEGKQYNSPIPKEVIDMVYDAVPADRRQRITIPGCDHSVILWLRDHPKEANQLLDQIDTFLRG